MEVSGAPMLDETYKRAAEYSLPARTRAKAACGSLQGQAEPFRVAGDSSEQATGGTPQREPEGPSGDTVEKH